MLSGWVLKNIDENTFRSYTGTTSENTDLHVLFPRWKYDVIYLTFSSLTYYCNCVAMRKGYSTGNFGKELY